MESTAQCWNALSNLDMGVEVRFSALAAWLRLIDPRKEEKHGRIAQTNTVTFSLSMNLVGLGQFELGGPKKNTVP